MPDLFECTPVNKLAASYPFKKLGVAIRKSGEGEEVWTAGAQLIFRGHPDAGGRVSEQLPGATLPVS